ncbi:NAD(P) transhydrogenase subunit alpha [Luedemannella helvata]|uniref:proton-translocating NAD(P)(+) transhydrogenase n=1 Tax=Luedemannella helvata TaxID=349315 RepID=A0ABP4VTM6_9ACTN
MSDLTVGVVREETPGERRVALVPGAVSRLPTGVVVQSGAGAGAWFDDDAYAQAGARLASRAEVLATADVIVCVHPPEDALRAGQALVGLLQPQRRPDAVAAWAAAGVTAISLDRLPRTLSRAQAMDALTSQASVAGYKAALVAATAYGGFFPLLTTAAGTIRPAGVLVLGTGVAGLQAIGTARRLGAVVSAYDVRPQARGEVESLGARFVDLPGAASGSGDGGYARALTEEEGRAQQAALAEHIARADVVITTAQVPGGRPPVLVTEDTVKLMRAGAVVVDLAAGPLGGNVAGSVPDTTVVTDNGVTVIGAGNLPATMAPAASTAYSRNITAVLAHLVRDGALSLDLTDEITSALVVTHDGVTHDGGAR